jgi:2-polyprenyl-3-methyl-5-hydroxy-6-metoxy-1,4-benzoquinol methylase
MPFFLSKRNTAVREQMDGPDCSKDALYKTYRRFSIVNSILSGWKRIYQSRIRPRIVEKSGKFSLLDIGFGGGDIPIKLAKWAAADGLDLAITAIDTDRRAVSYIQQLPVPANMTFMQASSTELAARGKLYDAVISNHLLHHLSESQLPRLLEESKKLSRQLVLFNDIERSDVAYGLFNLMSRPLSRDSFITQDGLASIKRSYTFRELQILLPEKWSLDRMFPYRLLASYHHE